MIVICLNLPFSFLFCREPTCMNQCLRKQLLPFLHTFIDVKQECISSASANSGFFTKHLYECIHYLVFIPDQIYVMVKLKKFILTNHAVRICFLSLPLLRSVPHMTMTKVPECSWPFVYTSNIEHRVVLQSMICFHICYVTYLHGVNGLNTTVVSILSLKRVLVLLWPFYLCFLTNYKRQVIGIFKLFYFLLCILTPSSSKKVALSRKNYLSQYVFVMSLFSS